MEDTFTELQRMTNKLTKDTSELTALLADTRNAGIVRKILGLK